MSTAHDENQLYRPSTRTILFAVAVVKSKPPGLSVGEYIRLLRLHFAKGKRSDAISSQYRYLDASAWWRSEFERISRDVKGLEDENCDLKREVEVLKKQVGGKKRKADVDALEARKRRKVVVLPVKVVEMPAEHAEEEDLEGSGEMGKMLLRCIFRIQTAVRESPSDEPEELVYRLEQGSSTISKLVQEEITACLPSMDSERLKGTLNAVTRAITSLFIGFKHICSAKEPRFHGRAIYAIVSMFKHLLSNIENLSAEEIQAAKQVTTEHANHEENPKEQERPAKAAAAKGSPMLSTLTSFLGDVIHLVDAKVEANRPVFEGLSYCIMERLGTRLFSSTFGHARAATIEAEIAQGDVQDEAKQQQINIEAPYLIHLLHRTMMAAPAHLGSATTKRTGKSKVVKKHDPKDALAATAKECLQRTLVNSMFGTEGTDEDDPFVDCLKMPSAGAGPVAMPKGKDVNLQEWYKEEVWRLLGWEILEKEEGLGKTS